MMRMIACLALLVSLSACGARGPLSAGDGVADLPGGIGPVGDPSAGASPQNAALDVPNVTPDGADTEDFGAALPDARPRRGGGFFGGLFRGRGGDAGGGAAMPDVLMLPGQVGKTCAVGRRARGAAVSQFPEDGRARWTIYDTAPGSTEPRTHYIDGFSDGCLRQTTAALVTFGAPDVHEAMRYDVSNPRGYSATDTAYETIKARVCGVRPRSPCPSDRIDRLSVRMAFVTIYPRFGGTGDRVELLLDQGQLVAQADLGG